MARKSQESYQQFEDVSSYSSSKEYKKRKKNRRGRAVLRGIGVFFCLLFILFGSGLVYVSTGLLSDLTTTSIAKDNETLVHPEENWEALCPVGADNKRNLCAHGEEGDGDIEAVLANSDIVIEHTYHTKALHCN